MTKGLTIAAAALAVALAQPAMAETMQEMSSSAHEAGVLVTSVKVDYADLNILSQAGARTLLKRIHIASFRVCGPDPGFSDTHDLLYWQSCIDRANAEAVKAVGSPLVAELYQGKHAALTLAGN